MNNENQQNLEDDIDLKELFLALWSKKILILSITSLAAIITLLYSLSLPNIYSSHVLLAPTDPQDSLSSKLGGYSSIAGLAGISIPGNSGAKVTEAIERIKSFDFFVAQFLPNIKFENLVVAKEWNPATDTFNYNSEIFNKKDNEWVAKSIPSEQSAYAIYRSILNISEDKKTSFTSIHIQHISPHIAQKWVKIIVQNINSHMRELDIKSAENSIDFLNSRMKKTSLSEIKVAISNLLQDQMKVLTLAESNKDYIFKLISSPMSPEKKSGPNRAQICILGTLSGLILSLIISLILHYFNVKKKVI